MIRKIIHIDEDKCNGCGICALACHEGAIDIVDGKAKLVRENFCDGLGDCLPACPEGAITFEEREAPAYDETAVKEAMKNRRTVMEHFVGEAHHAEADDACGCQEDMHGAHGNPGEAHEAFPHPGAGCPGARFAAFAPREEPPQPAAPGPAFAGYAKPVSRLGQWPCQIRLLPPKMPLYDGAKLLIAADCTAYAYANMHEEFMKGRVTMIGCPKLDSVDYTEKLTEIIRDNDVKEVLIVRMEVPCCGGIEMAAKNALQASGKFIPWQVVTISTDGNIL